MILNGVYLSAKLRIICKQSQSQTQSRTVLWSPRTIGRTGVLSTVRPHCGTTGVIVTVQPFPFQNKRTHPAVPIHFVRTSLGLSLSRPSENKHPLKSSKFFGFSSIPWYFSPLQGSTPPILKVNLGLIRVLPKFEALGSLLGFIENAVDF